MMFAVVAARPVVVVPVPTPEDFPGKPITCTQTGQVIVCQRCSVREPKG